MSREIFTHTWEHFTSATSPQLTHNERLDPEFRANCQRNFGLASSPQVSLGLITLARDGSRFHRPRDRGRVWDFSDTNTGRDASHRASPKRLQPHFMPPDALLAGTVFSQNEWDAGAKSK